jgi:hypothetical protein
MKAIDPTNGDVNESALFARLLPIEHKSLSFALWNMSWIAHNIWLVAHSGTRSKETLVEYAQEFRRNYYAQLKADQRNMIK